MASFEFNAEDYPEPNHSPEYREYIRSEAWAAKREERLRYDSYRCQHCAALKTEKTLQVHHRSYRNLGNEPLSDLVTLCEDCHEKADAERRHRNAWRRIRCRRR